MKPEKKSYFAKKVAADAALAERCAQIASTLRADAREEAKLVEDSQRLTTKDLQVYINARADNSLPAGVE